MELRRRKVIVMKKRILLYAALVSLAVAGCSQKKPVSEPVTETAPEVTTETETTVETETTTETEPATIPEFPGGDEETTEAVLPPVEQAGSKIVLATDIHYLSRSLTDFGEGFTHHIEHGDGKVVNYIWEITDAFVDAVISEKPEVVILSGDLTLNGEKQSHREFSRKLSEIEEAGIPVIVIPGNHDINNPLASQFAGAKALGTEYVTPEEFAEIYRDYGYDEAVSRDPASLSYIYQIDDYTRALMLDTCQYEPKNLVGGMIQDDTYEWIEEQMEDAWDLGMNVIPVGHHNLLDESEVYVEDCTIEHSEQLIDQLDSWDIPLFLSGHLHVQHFMREEEDYGIYEIVSSSLATPPCQYGILYYGDDGSFRYHTVPLDMEAWAEKQGSEDKNLLGFKEYSQEFLSNVFYNQAQDEFARMENFSELTKRQKDQMAKVYATLNSACYAGKVVEVKEQETEKNGYKLWEEYGYPSILSQYLESIVRDGTIDYNSLEAE